MKVHDRVEDALIVFLIEVLDAFVILALGTLMSCLGVKFFLGLVIWRFQYLCLLLVSNRNTRCSIFVKRASCSVNEDFFDVQKWRTVTRRQIIRLEMEEIVDEQRLLQVLSLLFAVWKVLERWFLVNLIYLDAGRLGHALVLLDRFATLLCGLWLSNELDLFLRRFLFVFLARRIILWKILSLKGLLHRLLLVALLLLFVQIFRQVFRVLCLLWRVLARCSGGLTVESLVHGLLLVVGKAWGLAAVTVIKSIVEGFWWKLHLDGVDDDVAVVDRIVWRQTLIQNLQIVHLLLNFFVGFHRHVEVRLVLVRGAARPQVVVEVFVAAALVERATGWLRKHFLSVSKLRVLEGQSLVLLASLPLDFELIGLHQGLSQVDWLIVELSQVARLVGGRTNARHHRRPHALPSSARILRCAPLGKARDQLAEHTAALLLLVMLLDYISYRILVALAVLHGVIFVLVVRQK